MSLERVGVHSLKEPPLKEKFGLKRFKNKQNFGASLQTLFFVVYPLKHSNKDIFSPFCLVSKISFLVLLVKTIIIVLHLHFVSYSTELKETFSENNLCLEQTNTAGSKNT